MAASIPTVSTSKLVMKMIRKVSRFLPWTDAATPTDDDSPPPTPADTDYTWLNSSPQKPLGCTIGSHSGGESHTVTTAQPPSPGISKSWKELADLA